VRVSTHHHTHITICPTKATRGLNRLNFTPRRVAGTDTLKIIKISQKSVDGKTLSRFSSLIGRHSWYQNQNTQGRSPQKNKKLSVDYD